MSTPRVTFEGLDIYTWAAARWLGIDPEIAREVTAESEESDVWDDEEAEAGRPMSDGSAFWTHDGA